LDYSSILEIEAARLSEMPINFYHSTGHNIQEHSALYTDQDKLENISKEFIKINTTQ
jgi:hypothetical protein